MHHLRSRKWRTIIINYLAHWRVATIGVKAAEAFMLGRHIAP